MHPRFPPHRLLAPTVLFSLILVVASTGGALYLRTQHMEASRVLAENVDSALAAKEMETTVADMIQPLRDQTGPVDARLAEELTQRLAKARAQVRRTHDLANHEP